MTEVDVVIVGAGLSGLMAGYKLHEKDPSLQIIIIEAKDRVGGRTAGKELKTASGFETFDVGGQWVGRCQKEVMVVLEKLGLETYPQYTDGRKLMQLGGDRVSSYTSEIPSLPLLSLLDLHLFMRRINKMQKEINMSDPGSSPHAAEWDAVTLEGFKRSHLWTEGARDALDASIRCVFGADPVHISLLYFMTYIACAGGLEPLISANPNFGGQELKVKGGAWQICSRLSQLLPSGCIKLSTPVKLITQSEDSSVTVETCDGGQYTCKRLILAIPPNEAVKIEYNPRLPLEKLHVFQRMPVGYLTKVIVTYRTTFWRSKGLSGEAVTIGGHSLVKGCDKGPLCIIFDATSSSGNPAIVSFIGGDQQLQYASLVPEERKQAVLHCLSNLFGPESLNPLDYCEKNWNEEPYNGGCPVCVGTPGMMTKMASALRRPFGSIHLAGTESATVWCGFLNGAVQAGNRAASEVLYHLRPKLLNSSDLEGTAYDSVRFYPNPPCRKSSPLLSAFFRFSFGIGGLFLLMLFARKMIRRYSSYIPIRMN